MIDSPYNKKVRAKLNALNRKHANTSELTGGFPWLATLLPMLAGPLLSKGVDALGSKLGFGKGGRRVGGRQVGGRRVGGRRVGGAKSSPWISHVKAYAKANGCSYKEALSRASSTYR